MRQRIKNQVQFDDEPVLMGPSYSVLSTGNLYYESVALCVPDSFFLPPFFLSSLS